MEEVDKQSKRLVKVGKEHVEECKRLLKCMGIPFVAAPCEAEAQCAELVKETTFIFLSVKDSVMWI